MGDAVRRSEQALSAGCDMLLMCNNRPAQIEILDNLCCSPVTNAEALFTKSQFSMQELMRSKTWKAANEALKRATEES